MMSLDLYFVMNVIFLIIFIVLIQNLIMSPEELGNASGKYYLLILFLKLNQVKNIAFEGVLNV